MDKTMTAADVVSRLSDGMTIGIGGWGARRKPMELVREICRSTLRDLRIVSYGGPDVGMLCSAGKVREVVFGFVSLDVIPLDPHFRRAREQGLVNATELDEGMLYWGLYAAALRLPFLPTRAGLASDVTTVNPHLRTITSPYEDGQLLLAMPAIPLDVALVHADRADRRGNAQVLGPDPHFDDLLCQAATDAYVSCERIVETAELTEAGCVHSLHLNRSVVSGVVELPFGAHPTSCTPSYGIDEEHLREYAASAGDLDWPTYAARYIDGQHQSAYVEAVGGGDRIAAIPRPVF